jgi:PAS domain S-box-containing protein/diguanylate cyclase (GGDEF)-like protein
MRNGRTDLGTGHILLRRGARVRTRHICGNTSITARVHRQSVECPCRYVLTRSVTQRTYARSYQLISFKSMRALQLHSVHGAANERSEASARELAQVLEQSGEAVIVKDLNAVVTYWNREAASLYGFSAEEAIGQPLSKLHAAELSKAEYERLLERVRAGHPTSSTTERRKKSGETIRVELKTTPLLDDHGCLVGEITIARDVTERERVAATLHRANRALRVLSTVNGALIQGESEPALLNLVCRALVDQGGYKLAWVGFAERDQDKSIRPVTQYGITDDFLEYAAISWADTVRGRGPTGTAARTGMVQISRDLGSDPRVLTWRAEALRRGYASSIALPLVAGSDTFGVLSIYSSAIDAFDDEEVTLLKELAAGLSFGVNTHRSTLERRRAEASVERLANFDLLTGLPNRIQLISQLEAAIQREGSGTDGVALMMLSVDRFSEIQEGVGIGGADDLLKKVALRLAGVAEAGNVIARIADDSFAIVIPRADAERAHELANHIQRAMTDPFELAGVPLDVRTTSGIALFPAHGAGADALIRRSDIAVRRARSAGIEYALYSGKGETETPQGLILLAELRKAIKDDELLLYYQPKIDVRAQAVSAVEALVRWPHHERGMVPPKEFIPRAEQIGLIKPLTDWVLSTAWKQINQWQRLGIEMPIAVNVSPNNLRDPDLLKQLISLSAQAGGRMDLLQLEVTESALMEDPEQSHDILSRIRDLGIQIFLDDFGTGYSSLSYIAALPIHALKIDRSFIVRMMQHERHRAVVVATITLAHSLGMKVIAEGVETADQAKAVIELGCDEIQGFFFSKPVPADEFLRWKAAFRWEPFGLRHYS